MKSKIKVLIVDDEQLAREGINLLLQKDPDIQIVGEAENGLKAVEILNKKKIDLVFLDIQMPGKNGFEVLDQIETESIPKIIFVTAFDQYALKAFEVNAVDYILKPFDDDKFYNTLEKAKKHITLEKSTLFNEQIVDLLNYVSAGSSDHLKKYTSKIPYKQGKEIIFIDISDIDYITAADYYITVFSKGKKYTIREALKSFEEKLDPEKFIRIHRSTIVNISQVLSIELLGKESYILKTKIGEKFEISKSRLGNLKQKLGM